MLIFGMIAGGLVTSLVSGLFLRMVFLMIRAGHANSRAEVMEVKQVFDLPKSSVHCEQSWQLIGTPSETELVNSIADTLRQAGGQIVRHDYDQLVVFFGSRQDARINGLYKGELIETPARLLLKTRDMHGKIWVQTRLDEDWGFNLMFGPMKRKFIKHYERAFPVMTEAFMPVLMPYRPKRIRIMGGSTGAVAAVV